LLLWKNRKLSINIVYISLLLLAFLDFYIHGSSASTIGAKMRHNDWEKESSIVASLEERMKSFHVGKIETPFLSPEEVENGLFRVYVEDGFAQHVQFLPYFPYSYLKLAMIGFNRPILNRIFMVDGYSPMLLKRYVLFNSIFRDKDYKKFLMLSNVKYIVKSDGTIDVLPNLEMLPRSYLVTSAMYIKNPDSIIDKLSDPSLDIRDEAIVEKPLELKKEGVCSGEKEAKVVEYYPNKIKLTTKSDCPSLLVIGDTYYPGWKVKVDSGIRTDALKVNYCFMGTLIPSGKHIVFFEFNPKSFKIGLIISIISAVSGVIIFLVGKKRKQSSFKI
jgi:hypothetical protein